MQYNTHRVNNKFTILSCVIIVTFLTQKFLLILILIMYFLKIEKILTIHIISKEIKKPLM